MMSRRLVPAVVLSFCPVAAFACLLAVSLGGARASQDAKAFPLSLFAQAKPDDYVDEQACVACHAEPHAGFERSPHKAYSLNPKEPVDRRGCQGCHGPGGPHIASLENPDEIYKHIVSYPRVSANQAALVCLRCHNDTMTISHWRRTEHARGSVGCNGCHQIHQPTEEEHAKRQETAGKKLPRQHVFTARPERGKLLKDDEPALCGECHRKELSEFRHNFHHPLPEGRMNCSDCHELHPRRASQRFNAARTQIPPAREHNRQKDVQACVTCHAETAGPFVFEHDPVHTGESCVECHRPHGSQNPRMLNSFSRGLCSQCHTEKLVNHFPGRTCWQSGCHVAVHGSNSDPLLLRR